LQLAIFLLPESIYPKKAISLFSASEFHARVENITLSINQVRYPIQLNPQHLLLWVFVGFWFAQRGDIFRVRVPYLEFMALSLFFQKVGVYGIKILQSK
jgi:hypothetical protein